MTRELADIWTWFADTSCGTYSPLYDRICRAVAADEDVLALIREAPPRAHQPNVLLAAVHYLLLGGLEHPLAAVYSGAVDADPGPLFLDVCLTQRDAVLELLATRHTNTNEVGRSALLGPAFTTVAARLGAPLALLDVGCSAGLNLLCDRYLLDYGPKGVTGPDAARVRIACEVAGGAPPIEPLLPPIAARVGLDRHPVDVHDPREAQWLLACVWPDTGRLPRTRAAIEEAQHSPLTFVQGDAVETVTDAVLALPDDATAVVTTTWALAYLSKENRIAFREALAAASVHRPIAWISGEGGGVVDTFGDVATPTDSQGMMASVLGLIEFREGRPDPHLLGLVHPHGNWVDWQYAGGR